jgi:hypothetical protein
MALAACLEILNLMNKNLIKREQLLDLGMDDRITLKLILEQSV